MASKRNVRRHSCEGKQRYSESMATRNARLVAQSNGDSNMGSYRCQFCGQFHVGHLTYGALQAKNQVVYTKQRHK